VTSRLGKGKSLTFFTVIWNSGRIKRILKTKKSGLDVGCGSGKEVQKSLED
jgi:hypothetical protein